MQTAKDLTKALDKKLLASIEDCTMTPETLAEVLFVKNAIEKAVFEDTENFPREDWSLLVYGSCLNTLYDGAASDIDMTLITGQPERYEN